MLSKALLKLIKSLEIKKFRKEYELFVAEGGKTVCDLINLNIEVEHIIATKEWLNNHKEIKNLNISEVSEEELKRASFLRTPQGVLAVFKQPKYDIDTTIPERELCLALDNVQDPGNLGTIIRIADWFGIENIYCSQGCADIYNPKTIQATMGAIGRVKIHYINLFNFLNNLKEKVNIYGTFLNGENIYNKSLENRGIIVMGNEGNGISEECSKIINTRLFVPNYPAERNTSESLNVSVATAIICSEFRRRF
ncbi:MAG: RNA methyltransferase [Bacteroidaceae bacterium]|nr:RNA methyltransferase [Bacteroidaceae bacterium]